MPYKSMKDVNPALKEIEPPITLAQANMIANWADSIEKEGNVDSPWAVAIAKFKATHHVEDGKWVPNEGSTVEHAVPAYVVDLYAELPQDARGKPDFSRPFRILPAGPIHRFGQLRMVTPDDIDLFAENWLVRENRGIRRKKVVIDVEHEPGGVGEYLDIHSRRDDGLWAKVALSPKGDQLFQQRDFHYFSPTVAWTMQDPVTGEPVRNQIVGGAFTNYPVFGDLTALPFLGYSEPALHSLWQGGIQIAGYATKTEDGVEYPASAYIVVEDPDHPTWHLRYKEYQAGKLVVTRDQLGKAAAALSPGGHREKRVRLTPEQEKTAKRKILAEYRKLDVPDEEIPQHLFSTKGGHAMTIDFTQEDRTVLNNTLAKLFGPLISRKGGDPMPEGTDNGEGTITVSEEAFSTLQQQVATLSQQIDTLSQERDQLQQQVQDGQTQLAAEVQARQLQEMREHVQRFSHLALPVEVPEGKEGEPAQNHFAWLFNADQTEGKQHWAFFNAVLKAANASLEEASAFSELGSSEQPLSEDDQLYQQALAYAQQHKVDYTTALLAVARGETPTVSSNTE